MDLFEAVIIMDAKTIETLAVNAVKDSVVMCEYLDQFIADNDKEPSWDGHIYVYKQPSKTKEHLLGRIPVQIKGTQRHDFTNEKIRHSVAIIDLKTYLKDKGVLYFVVCISPEGEKKIFYTALAPVKIRMILNGINNQNTITLDFIKFPNENRKKAKLCMDFLEECKKQASFVDTELLSPDAVIKDPALEGFQITFAHVDNNMSLEDSFLNSQPYLYAKMKGSLIPQPLMIQPEAVFLTHTVFSAITVNGITYYDHYERIKTQTERIFLIGNSVRIVCPLDSDTGTVSVHLSTMLRERVRALRFISALIKHGKLETEGHTMTFALNKSEEHKNEDNAAYLNFCEQFVQLLDCLRINQDVDLTELTKDDFVIVGVLIKTILKKEPITILKPLARKVCVKIGKLSFLLWAEASQTDESKIYLYDFFTHDDFIVASAENGDSITTSHLATLSLQDIISSDNCELSNAVKSFEKYANDARVYLTANNVLLLLLMASDAVIEKRQQFCQYALPLAEWLLKTPEDVILHHTSLLNKLQTIKRTRELTDNEKQMLWTMIEENPQNVCTQVCAYLLLDAKPMADHLMAQYDQETQNSFRELPIFHFN